MFNKRMKTSENKVNKTFRIEESIYNEFKKLTKDDILKPGGLIRELIIEFINNKKAGKIKNETFRI